MKSVVHPESLRMIDWSAKAGHANGPQVGYDSFKIPSQRWPPANPPDHESID
ncbi:hypothetical protein J2X73_004762 [Novosphingobium sp. 1748]|nr:hypothetical protein [Novosphingobium sp. 1748]